MSSVDCHIQQRKIPEVYAFLLIFNFSFRNSLITLCAAKNLFNVQFNSSPKIEGKTITTNEHLCKQIEIEKEKMHISSFYCIDKQPMASATVEIIIKSIADFNIESIASMLNRRAHEIDAQHLVCNKCFDQKKKMTSKLNQQVQTVCHYYRLS